MKKSSKVFVIDSETKQVIESTSSGLSDLQNHVGGYIEVAYQFVTKGGSMDTVYVNEDGLHGAYNFFEFEGAHQPFAGRGLVVGLDYESGDSIDVHSTLEEIKSKVKFFSLLEVRERWGR